MSTKTTFKRIALVAVAALGLGVLSVAPSSAAILPGAGTNTLTMVSSSSTIVAGESATATFTSSFIGTAAYDSVSVAAYTTTTQAPTLRLFVADSSTSIAGSAIGLDLGSASSAGDSNITHGVKDAGTSVTFTNRLVVYAPTVVGTYNISIYATPSSATAAGTTYATPLNWTFTVTARDTAPTANSTVTLRAGEQTSTTTPFNGTTEGTDSSTALTATRSITSDDAAATIYVVQKNATSTAGESITVVATGPAFITTSATRPVSGSALTLAADAAGTRFYVFSTGTAGTATITVSTPSLAMGSKTIKFFGAAASLAVSKAVAPKTVIRTTSGTSTDNVAVITVLDANANAVTNLAASAFTATPSDRLQIASASVGAYSSTLGGYPLSTVSAAGTSGKTATITVSIADPADTTGVKTLTTSHAVTMGGVVAKEVISFDKASYSPGEQMIITVTATDAAGNPVFTGAAAPALSSNKTIQGLANLATTYTGGKADTVSRDVDGAVLDSFRAYAPATAGDFRVTATGTDALATIISASATVADPAVDAATDAANEATDAANAATDAALAAADAADAATAAAQDASDAVAALSASVSKLISSLRAQITSLTNLVIKIQKKVRA
jgi:trimeric autotransporter adhesin